MTHKSNYSFRAESFKYALTTTYDANVKSLSFAALLSFPGVPQFKGIETRRLPSYRAGGGLIAILNELFRF